MTTANTSYNKPIGPKAPNPGLIKSQRRIPKKDAKSHVEYIINSLIKYLNEMQKRNNKVIVASGENKKNGTQGGGPPNDEPNKGPNDTPPHGAEETGNEEENTQENGEASQGQDHAEGWRDPVRAEPVKSALFNLLILGLLFATIYGACHAIDALTGQIGPNPEGKQPTEPKHRSLRGPF